MATNVVFLGWNRPLSGRERKAVELFQEFMQYLGGLQQAGTIQSFDAVFLNPHGGDMNGFILIQGDSGQLDGLLSSDTWGMHMTRADMALAGFGQIRGVTGDLLMKQMGAYVEAIPA
jgi:hypothetical protein